MSSAVKTASAGAAAALGQRPPRLMLRVVVYTALTLGIGAATLLVFIRHFERGRAEHMATFHASVVTQAVVDRLRAADLGRSTTSGRRAELDRLFRARVLDDETLGAAIATQDGRIAFATDSTLAGAPVLSRTHVKRALEGTVDSEIVSAPVPGGSTKVLRTYSAFRLADGVSGVLVVDKDYAPIAAAARRAAITVAGVLEVVLLSLWLCLFPVMRSVTRRIRRQLDTIAHQALHDDLTGLANRSHFATRLDEALVDEASEPALSVLFIDVDRFKEINDTLGHDSGNELLVEIGSRLEAALSPGELVARVGGDEFAVMSERAVDERSAVSLAKRLQTAMARPFEISGVSLEMQGSIGIALAPAHGVLRDELLRRADIAMYAAKRSGEPEVFLREHDDSSPKRLALTGELRRALERKELVVYYQPQVDLRDGRLHSAEALVRWRHPDRGFLGPDTFLTAAEHAGLMRNVTRYVLDESLGQLRSWRNAGLELRVAINVSGRDLADSRFPDEVVRALAEHGIDPSWLELEITESVIMSERARTTRVLERLADQGLRIAIDDFGVGYASLGYLKDLPAQVLKIDRSFVSSMAAESSSAVIVRSTIDLAHALGLEVIAEGVEMPEHLSRLRAAGCDVVQGYLLARPLPADDLEISARSTEALALLVPETYAEVVPFRPRKAPEPDSSSGFATH